jgi:hypothetical protein
MSPRVLLIKSIKIRKIRFFIVIFSSPSQGDRIEVWIYEIKLILNV